MQNKHKSLSAAILMATSSLAIQQAHATLPTNATLHIDAGVTTCTYHGTCFVKAGSYFGMDNNALSGVTPNERTAISENDGIIIGTAQAASGSHAGPADGSESPGIDLPWGFFGNTGMHYSNSAINILSTPTTATATLDLSGWGVTWNGIAAIDMGSGAWEGNPDGIAEMTCASDCTDGDTFILDYSARVPAGDLSGFGNVAYNLHIEGTISVPNTAPVANPVSISSAAQASHTWTPSVSDVDVPAQTLTCEMVTQPTADGAATVQSDCSSGTFTPTAGAGFTGTGSFTYRAFDTRDYSSAATVSYNISADPVPVCSNITAPDSNSGEVSTVALNIGINCSDSGGTGVVPGSVAVSATSANGGSVTVNSGPQEAVYTPAAGFSGTDTFTYTVDDGAGTSSPATVTITVLAKNNPGVEDGTFTTGATAQAAGQATDGTGIITATDIGVADNGSSAEQGVSQMCIGGCFDFTISGFTGDAQIVLPLSTGIPAPSTGGNIVYRKLKSTGWVSFDSTGNNAIHTVAGTVSGADIICPPATDSSYASSPGLTVGNRCLRLTIVDNGPNDDDLVTANTVADPGGLAEVFVIDTRTSSTDGCSMTGVNRSANNHADWWLVSAFIGLLGWFSLKRKQA